MKQVQHVFENNSRCAEEDNEIERRDEIRKENYVNKRHADQPRTNILPFATIFSVSPQRLTQSPNWYWETDEFRL